MAVVYVFSTKSSHLRWWSDRIPDRVLVDDSGNRVRIVGDKNYSELK